MYTWPMGGWENPLVRFGREVDKCEDERAGWGLGWDVLDTVRVPGLLLPNFSNPDPQTSLVLFLPPSLFSLTTSLICPLS